MAFLSGSIMSQPKLVQCVLISSCRRYQSRTQLLFLLWGFCHWFHFVSSLCKMYCEAFTVSTNVSHSNATTAYHVSYHNQQEYHVSFSSCHCFEISCLYLRSGTFCLPGEICDFYSTLLLTQFCIWSLFHSQRTILRLFVFGVFASTVSDLIRSGHLWAHQFTPGIKCVLSDHNSLPRSLCKYTPTPSFTGINKCVFSTKKQLS